MAAAMFGLPGVAAYMAYQRWGPQGDTAARQAGLGAAKLVLLTSTAGVLADPADPHSAISVLSLSELLARRTDGSVAGGMHVKSSAIEAAMAGGVERVHVVSGMDEDSLLVELYTNQGAGTLILAEAEGVTA